MKKKDFKPYCIDIDSTVVDALKRMDALYSKLLMVTEMGIFKSILSVGDIQRGLLKHNDFNLQIKHLLRENIKVAHEGQPESEIKSIMLQHRIEFMPVLNMQNELVDVIFWEDVYEKPLHKGVLNPNIPVIIMAGGKGTRLQPLTNIIPKPLIPVGEKTFIEHIIHSFTNQGLTNFHLSVNYKADLIKYYFDGIEKNYEVNYFHEQEPLGTAGSLHLMRDKINTTFFVSNCDILIDNDYTEILQYHQQNKNELTAVAAVKSYSIPYGTMEIGADGHLISLKEKPENTYYVNAGLYILEPHLLNEIPQNEFFHITHLMEKINARGGKVGVFPVSEGSWKDIGDWKEYLNIILPKQ
jgi:dTDP-glucose pyrophosphorylase